MPWILDEGRAGLLVDVTSPDALSRGMERIMIDEDLRLRLARAGFERARDEFSLTAVADRYLALLDAVRADRLLTSREPSPCNA